ncbi:MAG: RNA-binding protein [Desulfurococcaceae archaeon]
MTMEPRLIVTCRAGNEELCIHEVCNVLFSKDPDVKAEKSKYGGLIYVYTSIDVDKAYRIASFREYGFVENIIPVHCVLEYPLDPSVVEACLTSIVKTKSVKLKVKSRGVRGASSGLFALFSRLLLKSGVKHDSTAKTCLFVELLDSKVYVGLGDCHPVFKASLVYG